MELSIEQHNKLLADELAHLQQRESEVAKTLYRIGWLRKQCNEYEDKIKTAQSKGLTHFDRYET